ncbi:MAG: hypothetical protein ACRETA_04455 [Gammaproteobacteria bacterium]
MDFEDLARKYQEENERLRLELFRVNRSRINWQQYAMRSVNWVEHHYLFCMVLLLAVSYIVSDAIELYGTWNGVKKHNG